MMSRIQRFLAFGLLAASLHADGLSKPPSIIFILADDLGYADIGPFGQKIIHTPTLDKLAAEGMKFTQHYTGSPVCAPARCVLLTGKHPGHAFVRHNVEVGGWYSGLGQLPIPATETTIASALKAAGYTTGAFGKWGLDWLPTLLELAGATNALPKNADGISFAPTLLGGQQAERPFLYREFHGYGGQQAVRVGNWKLVRRRLLGTPQQPAAPTTELYDLAGDPAEKEDVAAAHPDMVARLETVVRKQHRPSKEFPFPLLDPTPIK